MHTDTLGDLSFFAFFQQIYQSCPLLGTLEIDSPSLIPGDRGIFISGQTILYLPRSLSSLEVRDVLKVDWSSIERPMWPDSLTYLSLVPNYHDTHEVLPTIYDLHRCPPKIHRLCVTDSRLGEKIPHTNEIDMNDFFNHLTEVEMTVSKETCRFILPACLKTLAIFSSSKNLLRDYTTFAQSLMFKIEPLSNVLRSLNINFVTASSQMTHLKQMVAKMKHLTHLRIFMNGNKGITRSIVEPYDLSPSLTAIEFVSSDANDVRDFCASISSSKTPNLKRLYLGVYRQYIDLPNIFNLPVSLSSLELSAIYVGLDDLIRLPPSLTKLKTCLEKFDFNDAQHLALLPRGLKNLDITHQRAYKRNWTLSIDVEKFLSHLPPHLSVFNDVAKFENLLSMARKHVLKKDDSSMCLIPAPQPLDSTSTSNANRNL
jgi:hypothetical protein